MEHKEGPRRVSSRSCFFIGPIGNRHEPVGSEERAVYEEGVELLATVVKPACDALNLDVVRADELTRSGEITEQVFRRLRDDEIVVADVTEGNANVMYELGLRHSGTKLTVLIGEFGRLPFDINVVRTIMFSRSEHGLIEARNKLKLTLEAGIAGEFDLVTASRIWNESSDSKTQLERSTSLVGTGTSTETSFSGNEQHEGLEEFQEDGFLEIMADAEDSGPRLIEAMEGMARVVERLGNASQKSTNEIEKSDAAGRGMRGRIAVAARYAAELDGIADEFEIEVTEYSDALSKVSAGNIEFIKSIEENPELISDPDTLEMAKGIRGLSLASREATATLGGLVRSTSQNANLSRSLRGPSKKLLKGFDRFVSSTNVVDEWDQRLAALGVPVPDEE